jgi:hypothetical protein
LKSKPQELIVLDGTQKLKVFDESRTNLGFPQEALLLDGCQKSGDF